MCAGTRNSYKKSAGRTLAESTLHAGDCRRMKGCMPRHGNIWIFFIGWDIRRGVVVNTREIWNGCRMREEIQMLWRDLFWSKAAWCGASAVGPKRDEDLRRYLWQGIGGRDAIGRRIMREKCFCEQFSASPHDVCSLKGFLARL